ncbi:hypothetical protein GA0115253_101852 [Streptomyces sp. Termitarium-T10T-6]|nr:hypothetical protein [Streptomyces sp. Termitarium-T10T-6]SCD79721.1 hypothetical protein GA0115253_101852 [Streptomyces sp. Termitarium-T10T-6]
MFLNPRVLHGHDERGAGTARGRGRVETTKGSSADMSVKYKKTARGGLAVNIIEC